MAIILGIEGILTGVLAKAYQKVFGAGGWGGSGCGLLQHIFQRRRTENQCSKKYRALRQARVEQ